jgi:hypothetical protein
MLEALLCEWKQRLVTPENCGKRSKGTFFTHYQDQANKFSSEKNYNIGNSTRVVKALVIFIINIFSQAFSRDTVPLKNLAYIAVGPVKGLSIAESRQSKNLWNQSSFNIRIYLEVELNIQILNL